MVRKKNIVYRVRVGKKNPSHAITVCHHSASLVIPIGDPRGGFSYPILTLLMDSYNIFPRTCLG